MRTDGYDDWETEVHKAAMTYRAASVQAAPEAFELLLRAARQPAAIDKEAVAIDKARSVFDTRFKELTGRDFAAPLDKEAGKPAAPGMTNGNFHCPACGEVMKGPTVCGSCLWQADTCGYQYPASPSVEQDEGDADEYLRATAQKLSDMGYLWQAENLRRAVGFPVADSKPAAPSVAQDELLLAAKEVLANGHQHDVGGGDVFVGTCEAAERLQRAVDARAASTSANVAQGAEAFPYQKTFNAIAAATSISGGHVAISVAKFVEAFGAAPPAQTALTDDARRAFEAWGNETFNYGFHPETWDDGAELPVARESGYQHEGTQMAWEGWQARAASTSANVTQGAGAVALTEDQRQILEWCKNYHFRRCTEGDFHLRIVAVVNQILAAPPAQTTLTDDAHCTFALLERHERFQMDSDFKLVRVPPGQSLEFDEGSATRRWLHPYLGNDFHLVGFIEPTAAQSASGDTK